jgi:hypothetical protein
MGSLVAPKGEEL